MLELVVSRCSVIQGRQDQPKGAPNKDHDHTLGTQHHTQNCDIHNRGRKFPNEHQLSHTACGT